MQARTLALILIAGCGRSSGTIGADTGDGGAAASDQVCRPKSGTRLRARFLRGGGAEVFRGWFDSQRREECTFRKASDGRFRCLPAVSVLQKDRIMYLDAACTRPLALEQAATCTALQRYVSLSPDDCFGEADLPLREVGERVVPGTLVHSLKDGACVSRPLGGNESVRVLGEVIPADGFAEGKETPGASGRIFGRALAGADGSRQPCGGPEFELFDRQRNEACRPAITSRLKQRCLPVTRAGVNRSQYTDAMCQVSGVVRSLAACPDPLLATASTPANTQCFENSPRLTQIYSLMAFAGAAYSKNDLGNCHAAGSSVSEKLWTPGPQVPDTTFAEAATVDAPGAGRLRARFWEWEGGHRQWTGLFFDTARGETCRPLLADDGKLRCLPGAARRFREGYRAGCAERARYLTADPCLTERSLLQYEGNNCVFTTRVFSIGERMPGSALHAQWAGGCMPAPDAPPEIAFLGAEVLPTELVDLTEQMD